MGNGDFLYLSIVVSENQTLEQQIKEEEALVNQLYRESNETDKQKMLEAFHRSVHMEAKFWEMAYQHQTWTSDLQSLEKEKK